MKQYGTKNEYLTGAAPNPNGKRAPAGTSEKRHYVQVDRTPANFKPKGDVAFTARSDKMRESQGRIGNARIFINAGLIFCSIIAVTLLIFYTDKLAVDSKYDKLLEEVEKAEQMATVPDPTEPDVTEPGATVPDVTEPTDGPGDVTEPTEEVVFDESKILPKYQSLYEKNNEFFGWIKIENTNNIVGDKYG